MTLWALWLALMIGQGGQVQSEYLRDGRVVSEAERFNCMVDKEHETRAVLWIDGHKCTVNDPCTIGDEAGWNSAGWKRLRKPEPQDVPAIRYKKQVMTDCWAQTTMDTYGHPVPCPTDEGWTCKDRTRILEHDEQTPAKYYCRKPQIEWQSGQVAKLCPAEGCPIYVAPSTCEPVNEKTGFVTGNPPKNCKPINHGIGGSHGFCTR